MCEREATRTQAHFGFAKSSACLLEISSGFFLELQCVESVLAGLGIAMTIEIVLTSVYYSVLIAWSFYMFFNSMQTTLPWASCDNSWNTKGARNFVHANTALLSQKDFSVLTKNHMKCSFHTSVIFNSKRSLFPFSRSFCSLLQRSDCAVRVQPRGQRLFPGEHHVLLLPASQGRAAAQRLAQRQLHRLHHRIDPVDDGPAERDGRAAGSVDRVPVAGRERLRCLQHHRSLRVACAGILLVSCTCVLR